MKIEIDSTFIVPFLTTNQKFCRFVIPRIGDEILYYFEKQHFKYNRTRNQSNT